MSEALTSTTTADCRLKLQGFGFRSSVLGFRVRVLEWIGLEFVWGPGFRA